MRVTRKKLRDSSYPGQTLVRPIGASLLSTMRAISLIGVALVAGACGRQVMTGSTGSTRSGDITSADQLLEAMRARYDGKWYENLTFVQKSSYLRPDGSVNRVETWYEAMIVPGRLRIDIGEPSRGTGALYRNDSVYVLDRGRIADRRRGRNPLMVLGFDVYRQPVAKTMSQLKSENINLSVLRFDKLGGRDMYVVGAGPTDSTSNQFWIDAERLLFVRLIQTNPQTKRTADTRFENYVKHGGGWVAEEVRVLVGGRMVFHEEYSKVRANVEIDPALFLPEKWTSAKHWFIP
jgi:hypothetical protein